MGQLDRGTIDPKTGDCEGDCETVNCWEDQECAHGPGSEKECVAASMKKPCISLGGTYCTEEVARTGKRFNNCMGCSTAEKYRKLYGIEQVNRAIAQKLRKDQQTGIPLG